MRRFLLSFLGMVFVGTVLVPDVSAQLLRQRLRARMDTYAPSPRQVMPTQPNPYARPAPQPRVPYAPAPQPRVPYAPAPQPRVPYAPIPYAPAPATLGTPIPYAPNRSVKPAPAPTLAIPEGLEPTDSPVSSPALTAMPPDGSSDAEVPPVPNTLAALPGEDDRKTVFSWDDASQAPFTSAWHEAHPEAWQLDSASDPYVPTDADTLALWLGLEQLADAGTELSAEEAVTLAGGMTENAEVQWMTLGVFAMSGGSTGQASRVLHLAISNEGQLRGTHYDLLTDQAVLVHGAADRRTSRFAFGFVPEGPVTFSGHLRQFAQSTGVLLSRHPDSSRSSWQIVRMSR